jgi:hypothetical protein
MQAGVSEVGVYYGVHAQITTFPMPLNVNDVGYDYEAAVAVINCVYSRKRFGKSVQSDSGEVMVDVVGNKGNKKTKFICFYILVTARNC